MPRTSSFIKYLGAAMADAEISTYEELSRRTGIAQSTISGWKRGAKPKTDAIARLANALEVSPRRLLVEAGIFTERQLPPDQAPPRDYLLYVLENRKFSEAKKKELIQRVRDLLRDYQELDKRMEKIRAVIEGAPCRSDEQATR